MHLTPESQAATAICPICNSEISLDGISDDQSHIACGNCGERIHLERDEAPAPEQSKDVVETTRSPMLHECEDCGKAISLRARSCPHCGAWYHTVPAKKKPRALWSPIIFGIIGILVFLDTLTVEPNGAIQQTVVQIRYLTGLMSIGIAVLIYHVFHSANR